MIVVRLDSSFFRMENLPLQDDYAVFLKVLNKHEVEYLIIGAHASMFHGHFARSSKDMDFWIRQSYENGQRVSNAVMEFSGSKLSIETIMAPKQRIEIGSGEFKIEMMTYLEGVEFDEAWGKKVLGEFFGEPAYFISKDLLIKLKKLAGRYQDLQDLERLNSFEEK